MARPTAPGSVFLVAFALAVGLGYSCGDTVPLDERNCPCLSIGYVCCNDTCIKPDAACTDADAAAGHDGSGEHRRDRGHRRVSGTGGMSGTGGG